MSTLDFTITDAGRQALIDGDNMGTLPLRITQIKLGTGRWSPDGTATALLEPLKWAPTIGGLAVAPDTIHVTITDDSADAYSFGEFGLVTDGGVLFGIYSDPDGIMDKAADALLLFAADVVLATVPAGSVVIDGSGGFSNPPSTEDAPGVAELATQAETEAGTDDSRIVTPKKLMDAASSSSIANKLVRRDNSGNFRTNAPVHDNDVPRKIDLENAIAALLNAPPAALDTLNELAAALGDDPNFATTMTNALAGKQPLDATLTALAALATAADKLIYATGSDTFATATLTAFACSLLDDTSAATARGTLGAIAATNYATASTGGTVKMRLSGTDLFIRNDGVNA